MTKEVSVSLPGAVEIAPSAAAANDLLLAIVRAVADPAVDPAKMAALLAIHKEILADKRKAAFIEAKRRVIEELPQFVKSKKIIVKGAERSRYVPLEDIDRILRPLMVREGLSFSFDNPTVHDKTYTVTCDLEHVEGHSERNRFTLPYDHSEFRSGVQNAGSTMAYARRLLIKMHFNIVEVNEDDDGSGSKLIDQAQQDTLRSMLEEVASNVPAFVKWLGLPGGSGLADIPASEYERSLRAIESRRKNAK
jgi:hypothetical protein